MAELSDETVKHLSPEVLNFAVWRAMSRSTTPPKPLQAGAQAYAQLSPEDLAALKAFAPKAWQFVSGAVFTTLPGDQNSPLDEEAWRQMEIRIRQAMPWLNQWTFEVITNVAVTHAMM